MLPIVANSPTSGIISSMVPLIGATVSIRSTSICARLNEALACSRLDFSDIRLFFEL